MREFTLLGVICWKMGQFDSQTIWESIQLVLMVVNLRNNSCHQSKCYPSMLCALSLVVFYKL